MIYKLNTQEGINSLIKNSTSDTISNMNFPWERFICLFKYPVYITQKQIFEDILLDNSKRLVKVYKHITKNHKTTKDIDFSELMLDLKKESDNHTNPIYLHKISISYVDIVDSKTLQSSLQIYYTIRYVIGDRNCIRWMEDMIDIRDDKYNDLFG